MSLDERKKSILQAIIKDYINLAEPIGSRTIAKKHELGLSSATIRNEMSDLEDMGYLEQPHTSAGRIPSDKGYRLYVDELMKVQGLTLEEVNSIKIAMEVKINELNQLLRQAADVISRFTQYTSMTMTPHMRKSILKSVKIIPIDIGKALIIIITSSGTVRNNIIKIPEGISLDYLARISNMLDEKLSNLTIGEISSTTITDAGKDLGGHPGILKLILEGVTECILGIDKPEVYLEGTANIFNFPEFRDIGKAKEFLRVLDEMSLLRKLLNSPTKIDGVNIQIGAENEIKEIKDCSLVKAIYSVGDVVIGSIGVIGPTRMDYSRVISSMIYIQEKVNQEIYKLFGE